MTTELRQQLNAIALPEIGSKKTVTLIFTPEEARNQTIETIYNIGKNGLYELIRLDPNFLRFDTTLFGIKMRTMDRFLETEKVNEELNKLIHDFLCTLSPYIMLKASQKCLEYLLRHFSIHTLNVSDVVMCILPYHETSLFPKIVSLLSVENDSLWYFLTNIKRSKAPLLRQYLGNQCSKDQGLLEYILNYITEMNNEGFNMNMHLTLVSALIFDYTKSHTVTESELRILFAFILKGMKCVTDKEYQCTAYLLFCHLCSKMTLEEEVMSHFIQTLFSSPRSDTLDSLLQTYLIVKRSNRTTIESIEGSLSSDCLYEFLSNDQLLYYWKRLTSQYDCSLLVPLLLVPAIELFIEKNQNFALVQQLFETMKKEQLESLFESTATTMESFLTQYQDQKEFHRIQNNVTVLLRYLATQFSVEFDTLFATLSVQKQHLNELINAVFNGSEHMMVDQGMTLYHALHHTENNIRLKASQTLLSLLFSSDKKPQDQTFYREELLNLLHDTDVSIVQSVLSLSTEQCLSILDASSFLEALYSILSSPVCLQNTKQKKEFLTLILNHIQMIGFESEHYPLQQAITSLFAYLPLSSHTHSYQKQVLLLLSKLPTPLCTSFDTLEFSATTYSDLYTVCANNLKNHPECLSLCLSLLSVKEPLAVPFVALHILMTYCSLTTTSLVPIYNSLVEYFTQYIKQNNMNVSKVPAEFHSFLLPSRTLPKSSKEIILSCYEGLYELIQLMDMTQFAPMSPYGELSTEVSHPTNLLIFLLSIQKSCPYLNSIMDSLLKKTSTTHPLALYLDILSLSVMYKNVFEQILIRIKEEMNSLTTLEESYYEPLFSSLVFFLCNDISSIRSSTLSIFETLQKLFEKTQNHSIYSQFTNLILTLKPYIMKDQHSFSHIMNQIFINEYPTVSKEDGEQYNELILSMILTTTSIYRKNVAFVLFKSLYANEQQATQIRDLLLNYFNSIHYTPSKEVLEKVNGPLSMHQYDVRIFKNLLKILLKSASEKKRYSVSILYPVLSHYLMDTHTYYYYNQKKQIIDSITPIEDVILSLDAQCYSMLENEEKYQLFHQLYTVILSPCDISSNVIYSCINSINVPLCMFVKEANAFMKNELIEFDTLEKKIDAFTVFMELYSNTVYKSDMNGMNMLIELIKWILSLVPTNMSEKKLLFYRDQQNRSNSVSSTTVDNELFSQSISYVLQIIIECIYTIITTSIQNSSKEPTRKLSNCIHNGSFSVTIEQDIEIEPSLLISCIQLTSSLQLVHITLKVLSVLCQIQKEKIFPHLFLCLQQLVSLVFTDVSNNYEYIQIIFKILSTCGPYLKDKPDYIVQLFTIIIPCILFMPINSAYTLSNQLIGSISVRYLSHFILYLLCIYDGYSMGGIQLEENQLVIQLEEQQPFHIPIDKQALYHFIFDVLENYSIGNQIQCILFILASCEYLPYDENDVIVSPTTTNETNKLFKETVQSILDLIMKKVINEENALSYFNLLLHFISDIVMNAKFISSITQLSSKEESTVQNLFLSITEYLLLYIQISNDHISMHQGDEELLSNWQQCQEYIYTILNVINELMNIPAFITVITELLTNEDISVRKRALQMLNTKLESSANKLTVEEQSLFIDLVENITEIITNPEETILNKQTGILSLHVLSQYFCASAPESFVPAFKSLVELTQSLDVQQHNIEQDVLLGSIYMCLTVMINNLSNKIIPYINVILKVFLSHFEYYLSLPLQNDMILLYQSFLTVLAAILTNQSKFLSPYLHRICLLVLNPLFVRMESNIIQKQLYILYDTLSKYMTIRFILPEMNQLYKELNYDSECICRMYYILNQVCVVMNEKDMLDSYVKIWELCLMGLNSRYLYKRQSNLLYLEETTEHQHFCDIETSVIECMMSVLIRLNEKQFKPLYMNTVEWMEDKYQEKKEEIPSIDHCIGFYSLIFHITDKLKSIFVPYFSSINENIELLMKYLCKHGASKNAVLSIEESSLLIKIVDSLQLCFKYNTIDYVDEGKFNTYSNLLVDCYQCIHFMNGLEEYQEFILTHVCPAITSLVVSTTGHDVWWKQLNYNLLLFTRENNDTVKYVALKTIQECFAAASQDYITLIPDVIPFLANLLEDSDATIEKLANDVKIQLETLSGEQLDTFLTV